MGREMTYTNGETVAIMGKTFTLADIDAMTVDNRKVADGTIGVSYDGTSASVTVAGNVAQYVTPTISGGSSVKLSSYTSGGGGGPGGH